MSNEPAIPTFTVAQSGHDVPPWRIETRVVTREEWETAAKVTDTHRPYADDGVTYCGWDGHDGCGHSWPCPTVLARRDQS